MEYVYPSKDLLESNSDELKDNKKYYSLKKLILKEYEKDKLIVPLGIDEKKEKYYMDFSGISSLLIVGETGSGKSNFINSILISLLFKNSKEELELFLIDSSGVELKIYEGLPLVKNGIKSDTTDGFKCLKNVVNILEERREIFANAGFKNIMEYNKINKNLLHIFVIIDDAREILEKEETKSLFETILREGYKFGIHLIISTSAYIKNTFDEELLNEFTYKITFDLASAEQSDLIKINGAHLLTTEGDILIKCRNDVVHNIQTPYVSENDIKKVVEFIKGNNK